MQYNRQIGPGSRETLTQHSHTCSSIAYMYLIIDGKIADLHCHGDEVDGTVEFILFKPLL